MNTDNVMTRKIVGWALIFLGAVSLLIGLSYFFLVGYLLDPKGASDEGEKLGWTFSLPGILGLVLGWLALKKKS